ncbi:MAG: anaerobic ribonucleoside-triphosphate reductase activating protein [Candidatus Bipolaricaulota bacterium]|nr:MAG: anaerobic ribonucleoside-triphosphate reductase activating protein [Candidatus Bipolaricaulota bacterium]
MPEEIPDGEPVPVAAIHPVSLVDYPGHIASVVFLLRCNYRCPYCHNAQLVVPGRFRGSPLPWGEVLRELEARRGFIDGVVISGGEPLLTAGLSAALEELRALGIAVKLDTNGSQPDALAAVLDRGLVDYVAVDVKAPWERYDEFTGVASDVERVRRTVDLVRCAAPDYELRTTVAPTLTAEDVLVIADQIGRVRRYILQPFVARGGETLIDPAWASLEALSAADLQRLWAELRERFDDGGVRAG